MSAAALYNGETAADWTQARGLHYGDGVFRTLLVWEGECQHLDAQLERLDADAARLGLRAPDARTLRTEASALAQGQSRAVLKILLWRQATGRGYAPQGETCDRLLLRSPAPRYPVVCWDRGILAQRSPVTLARQPLLAGIKHLNRLEQVLASRGWAEEVQEVLMADTAGQVIAGSRSNLFWIRDGQLCTPELAECGIAGLQRAHILALARREGLPLAEAPATWDTLQAADEAFVCNSLIGIWPLHRLDAHTWPALRPLTRRLQALLDHPRLD